MSGAPALSGLDLRLFGAALAKAAPVVPKAGAKRRGRPAAKPKAAPTAPGAPPPGQAPPAAPPDDDVEMNDGQGGEATFIGVIFVRAVMVNVHETHIFQFSLKARDAIWVHTYKAKR